MHAIRAGITAADCKPTQTGPRVLFIYSMLMYSGNLPALNTLIFSGLGVRHALFPDRTRLGALAFAGCVLPDATLRGIADVSVSWRDRPDRCRPGSFE
jgi:hypothetical protein